jgi:hypothetical protein
MMPRIGVWGSVGMDRIPRQSDPFTDQRVLAEIDRGIDEGPFLEKSIIKPL